MNSTNLFCTNFDKNFLIRGLALHDSMLRHSEDFSLWVYCMDEETHSILSHLNLRNMRVLHPKEFENEEMLEAKSNRDIRGYYSTCKPYIISDALKRSGNGIVTYVDADIFFFAPPTAHLKEFDRPDRSVMLVPHRFPAGSSSEKTSGIYNAGIIAFRNDEYGREALRWWEQQCFKWCDVRYENGKYGDQMYLDEFEKRFKNVFVLRDEGSNVAYWNAENYAFSRIDSDVVNGRNKITGSRFRLNSFHFSGIKLYRIFGKINYLHIRRQLNPFMIRYAYTPYLKSPRRADRVLRSHGYELKSGFSKINAASFYASKLNKQLASWVHFLHHSIMG